jgi:alkylhydroperoxidase/carboxymuconolactone decarboxylase family protein YurZ
LFKAVLDFLKQPIIEIVLGTKGMCFELLTGINCFLATLQAAIVNVWPHVTKNNIAHLIITVVVLDVFPTMAAGIKKILEKNMPAWTGKLG